MGLYSGTRFGFMHTVPLQASCLDVRESIANAGMRDSSVIVQLSEKPGEKRKYCKVSRKELKVRSWESVCFPLVGPGVLMGEGKTHMEEHGTSWMDRMFRV